MRVICAHIFNPYSFSHSTFPLIKEREINDIYCLSLSIWSSSFASYARSIFTVYNRAESCHQLNVATNQLRIHRAKPSCSLYLIGEIGSRWSLALWCGSFFKLTFQQWQYGISCPTPAYWQTFLRWWYQDTSKML